MRQKIMEKLQIKLTKRSEVGKNANNRLRASGNLPVNIIWEGNSIPAAVSEREVEHILNSGIRPATLIAMDMEGENGEVFVKEVQRTPGTNRIRHIDFYRVTPGKKITAKVGIITRGVAKGVKSGGMFEHLIHEIKVKSTPEDLKDVIEIDVTPLGVGDSIKVKDISTPDSWEILVNGNPIVTSVNITKSMLAQERAAKAEAEEAAKGKKK